MALDVRASVMGQEEENPAERYENKGPLTVVRRQVVDWRLWAPRGMGVLRVDYNRSYHDIWRQAVKFVFFQGTPIETRFQNHPRDDLADHERSISIVRTAGIIQAALGGQVERESPVVSITSPGSEVDETPIIRSMGYLAGRITEIGPDYFFSRWFLSGLVGVDEVNRIQWYWW